MSNNQQFLYLTFYACRGNIFSFVFLFKQTPFQVTVLKDMFKTCYVVCAYRFIYILAFNQITQ